MKRKLKFLLKGLVSGAVMVSGQFACVSSALMISGQGINVMAIEQEEKSFAEAHGVEIDNSRLLDIAYEYINAPYSYGGKGNAADKKQSIDCSGFVTTVYKNYLGTIVPSGKSTSSSKGGYGWLDVDGKTDKYGIKQIASMNCAQWESLLNKQNIQVSNVCKIYKDKTTNNYIAEEPNKGWDYYSPGDLVMWCSSKGKILSGNAHIGFYTGNGNCLSANANATKGTGYHPISAVNYHKDSTGYAYFKIYKMVDNETIHTWEPESFSLNYHLDNGFNDEENPDSIYVSQELKLEEPTRVGYKFEGWFTSESFDKKSKVSTIKGTNKNLDLYAKWTPVKYSISYKLDGGTNDKSNPSSFTIEDDVVLKKPTKKYYDFEGWYADKDLSHMITSIAPGTNENLKLYAKWAAQEYDINYVITKDVDNSKNPEKYTSTKKTTLSNPKRKGYTFVGWYTDASYKTKSNVIASGSQGTKTFYAKWKPVTYTIKYELKGGTNNKSNPSTFTAESPVTLKTPSRKGYNFLGWYTDSTYKKRVYSASFDMVADGASGIKLYANWISSTYNVVVELPFVPIID